MTQDNDGWGKPYVAPAANVMLQSQNAAANMQKLETQMRADGWTSVVPGEWVAPGVPQPINDTWGDAVPGANEFDATGMWPTYVANNYDDDGNGNLTAKPDPWLMPDDIAAEYDNDSHDWGSDMEPGTPYGPTDDERARAINACIPLPKDTPWVVDVPDGELTLKEDYMPTVTENEATGFYVAYSQGILHAVLAGPYDGLNAAHSAKDRAWARFQADPNFALAFDKAGWNASGLYVAEIPLKARRRGAYGPI